MTALRRYLLDLCEDLRDQHFEGEVPPLSRLFGGRIGQFGVALCDVDGEVTAAGTRMAFPIQSISKAFAYGTALDLHGLEYVSERVDEEPTGEVFNAISLDPATHRPKNALVNIGAIRTHAMLGTSKEERTARLLAVMNAAAGRELEVHEETFTEELSTADRNLALAYMLRAAEAMEDDAEDVVTGYLRGCAVLVTVEDLAVMAATLADGGVNPRTGERVFSPETSQQVLSVMLTCGMYDDAGDWVSDVGLPAKSGVAGGIIAALPARFGIATYGPMLDAHGNSVRGAEAFQRMSRDFGLHMLRGEPPADLDVQAERLIDD